MPLPEFFCHTPLHPSFVDDILDTHIIYEYDAADEHGNPEKWRYECWFFSEHRVVYSIHSGPMKGRQNYQTCSYQCIRPGEIWQCNFLEETGTFVSLVYDLKQRKITTGAAFSKGHWEHAKEAHGDKRNLEDFERWRGLAKLGIATERLVLGEQADVLNVFKGPGKLQPIAPDAVTF
ncbi:putative Phenol acid carboxylase [Mycena sanguinolenta]|uniref:Putative Phenol acid carboxylase n=1 Tax=Mycena sanguinolenta TaxID=230812 RepID=A0A8H7D450_9AGAR|nr:putative Phenol acid carboxylase [Mycena sanguinolenta]